MKKILTAGMLLLASNFTFADKPLLIQSGEPETMIEHYPVAESGVVKSKNHKDESQRNSSLFVEYSVQDGRFENDINEELKGFGVGFSSSQHKNGFWGKIEYQQNKEYDGDAYEFSFGGHLNFVDADEFYALGTFGAGVSILDVAGFDTSSYLTLPIGLEAGYAFTQSFSLYAGVGYKWSWDISAPTTCENGTQSNSVGSGACSWNGGIDHYNYTIGDYDGVTYKTGLRYNF